MSTQAVSDLVPYAHVADVARSIAFYRRLGFAVVNTAEFQGHLGWARLQSGDAQLMVAGASGPINADQQAVLFYLYANDVAAFRTQLIADGIDVGEIGQPDYMPAGEIRVHDPDGYVLLIGQLRA